MGSERSSTEASKEEDSRLIWGEAMSGLFWFVAGFLSCLAISLLSIALVVWRTPPASEQLEGDAQSAQPSRETAPQPGPSILSKVRRHAGKSGR